MHTNDNFYKLVVYKTPMDIYALFISSSLAHLIYVLLCVCVFFYNYIFFNKSNFCFSRVIRHLCNEMYKRHFVKRV